MDLLSPFTTLIEWVWCAAQVGATYVEIFLFGASLLLLIAVSYHMHRWQKKIMLTLQAVQTQLQENSKADDLGTHLAGGQELHDVHDWNSEWRC